MEVASHVNRATTKVPFFWVDDVYKGFCAWLANIRPIDIGINVYEKQTITLYFDDVLL